MGVDPASSLLSDRTSLVLTLQPLPERWNSNTVWLSLPGKVTSDTIWRMMQGEDQRVSRRALLKWSGAAGIMAIGVAAASCTPPYSGPGQVLNGVSGAIKVMPGFSARVIARGNEVVSGTGYQFAIFPDGAATFVDTDVAGGWYLAVNHEVPGGSGGVSSIRFAPDGSVVGAERILGYTSLNCAGGATPWGTWLSCEEFDGGRVFECDPTGTNKALARPALGAFAHEAAAVGVDDRLYLTEDRPDGGFYRFTPDTPGDLSSGLLEVATGAAPGPLTWVELPNPSSIGTLARYQVASMTIFDGGEGIDTQGDDLWFTTKGDSRIWHYSLATSQVSVHLQAGGGSMLDGLDNLWLDEPSGSLLVAEDGDDMQIVMVRPDLSLESIVQILGNDHSEITGPCFSPDGSRLYFSSQRGGVGPLGTPAGVTYEVTGDFDSLLGRP